jgi:hypothetical protein
MGVQVVPAQAPFASLLAVILKVTNVRLYVVQCIRLSLDALQSIPRPPLAYCLYSVIHHRVHTMFYIRTLIDCLLLQCPTAD